MNKDSILRTKHHKGTGVSFPVKAGGGPEAAAGWEMRPGGMLVQKRTSDSNQKSNHVPNIKVKVKYGSCYHEVVISSQASFGDLKKMLAGPTGLHPQDQKMMFKEKEKDSKVFLDFAGVKDGSKIVLIEEDFSRERRCVESRKNAKMDKALKEIAAIRLEVDKLAKQVAYAELEINGRKKVVETVLLNLIELLMTQLIKLDAIDADGDVKLQRRMQVKRVQKYIEILDMLKIRNSGLDKVSFQQQQQKVLMGDMHMPNSFQNKKEKRNFIERVNPGQVVVTTKWETF